MVEVAEEVMVVLLARKLLEWRLKPCESENLIQRFFHILKKTYRYRS